MEVLARAPFARGGKAPEGGCWLPLGRRALAGAGEKVGDARGPVHAGRLYMKRMTRVRRSPRLCLGGGERCEREDRTEQGRGPSWAAWTVSQRWPWTRQRWKTIGKGKKEKAEKQKSALGGAERKC